MHQPADFHNARPYKTRILYATALLLIIALGLASRKYAQALPPFLAEHAGDALWAAMVYVGIRLLLPARPLLFAAVASLLFSFAIELSQLYQADWIVALRHTTPGALVLGRGFLPLDLLRYAVGVLGAFGVDWGVRVTSLRAL
ncbi:ribosomal maturation YjgA family protein [Cesiribacter andamanensis]|uniref:Uncharacterized protein n=1 Tax=Cesiribacter andamanensis AMV16 TaxID=1279009 RepID=M7N9Q5_9BACT|nr:DUF2809 domain-containing protein [Cesiribacter andamanensis]EMR03936.1 hypothetical protein ADICEAN_00903 [Cesiribacter andamanensis AMV16]